MEVTKWLKPSISVSRIGDSASVQAATRVNAEHASKMSMCRPTRRPFRGRLTRLGEMSEEYAQPLLSELLGCPISRSLTTCCVGLELRPLPSPSDHP
jgi:hypothetical protein